jgi:hypothetical protein
METTLEQFNNDINDIIKTNMKLKRKEYNNRFFEKNKERLIITHICDICLGKYKYVNKSHHNKTAIHIRHLEKLKV